MFNIKDQVYLKIEKVNRDKNLIIIATSLDGITRHQIRDQVGAKIFNKVIDLYIHNTERACLKHITK